MKISKLHVKTSGPPTLEIDHAAGAAYLRFGRAKVAKTIERTAGGIFMTVDLDRNDGVVGIEVVGAHEIQIHRILRAASVEAPKADFSRTRYVPAQLVAA